jgi:hypothetical protein
VPETVVTCEAACQSRASAVVPVSFRTASWRVAGADDVIPVEAQVLWRVMVMATRSGTPALTRFRTAVRRQSWRSFPDPPLTRLQPDLPARRAFACRSVRGE